MSCWPACSWPVPAQHLCAGCCARQQHQQLEAAEGGIFRSFTFLPFSPVCIGGAAAFCAPAEQFGSTGFLLGKSSIRKLNLLGGPCAPETRQKKSPCLPVKCVYTCVCLCVYVCVMHLCVHQCVHICAHACVNMTPLCMHVYDAHVCVCIVCVWF